jgi:hypothetical protein
MRTKKKPPKRKPKRTAAGAVAAMAASGMCEDQIALRLSIHKNTLRAQHIDELIRGRAVAAASKTDDGELTKGEAELLASIRSAFDSHWWFPEHGCGVFWFAKTHEEAWEMCRTRGHRAQGFRPWNELPETETSNTGH